MADEMCVARAMQVIARYAEALDARDEDAIRAVLSSDVQLTRSGETVTGRDAFLDAYRPFLDSDSRGSRHQVTNPVVDVIGPDKVTVRSCFDALFFDHAGTRRVVGRYEDDLSLVQGTWVISHKRNIMEWAMELPVATRL